MTAARNILPLSAVVALLGILVTPALAFRVSPSIEVKKHGVHNLAGRNAAQHQHHPHRRSTTASTTLLLSSPDDDIPNNNSREQEMMDKVLREQSFRQGLQQEAEQQMPPAARAPDKRVDGLIASLTRIDEPTPADVPMRQVPLFGEVPADGNLALLVPAAVISILGFIFSIVVAFNARDSLVSELSKVDMPKMEYTPTVVDEGKCRGLCSSQDEDLDGLRNFMESISRKD
ncbi:hypothetical protein ACHAXR_011438 [Thalassiosira sp. AJA248-18]